MIAGAMSPFRRGLTWILTGLMLCWFTILFVILAIVIVRYVVQERNVWVILPCGIGAGIWLTALVLQFRWLRALVCAYRHEDGVLWVRTFASRRERAYLLSEIAGVEEREGRGGYRYFKVVLRDRGNLILDPGLANSAALADQLRFDLDYAPFVPSGGSWPPIFAVVMLGSGMLTAILAGLALFGAIRWHIVGSETTGTVTAFRQPPDPDRSWIEVTYEVDGQTHVIRPANWNAGHGKPAYTVGEKVPVLFLADQPDVGIVNNFREQGEVTLFLGFFGAFCLVCGSRLWYGKAK
jgi:hypothetical protein